MKSKIYKQEEFKILTPKEEQELTDSEKLVYYRDLRNFYRNKKINYMGIRLREVFHPFLLGAIKLTRRDDLNVVCAKKIRPQGPVIFAVNHSNVHDVPYASEVIDEHYYLLAGNEVPDKPSEFLFSLNGVVFVDRKNKESRANSKEELIKLLLHGKNIMMFPEGTWNLSPNKIMLPLNWGIIEIAQKSGCPIVPLILDHREGITYVNVGDEIYVSPLDDKKEQIDLLRDKMCTLRWEIWEKFPTVTRENFEEQAFDAYIENWLKEYPKLDANYESTIIFKNRDENSPEEVFAPIKKLEMNRNNAFLFGKYKK